MEKISPPVITVVVDPEYVSFKDRLRLHLALNKFIMSELKKSGDVGGLKLLSSTSYDVPKKPFDTSGLEYDLFETEEPQESPTSRHFTRQEVYETVRRLAKPDEREKVILSLDDKFPSNIWDGYLPDPQAIAYLVEFHHDSF